VKSLLNNRFAPVTFSWGFLEKPVADLVEFQVKWTKSLRQPEKYRLFQGDLPSGLESLEPLNAGNVLYISTRSAWTSVFQGCLGVTSPVSQVSYPAEVLGCRGLIVTYVEDTFDRKSGKGLYGGVSFELFAPHRTAYLNCDRVISAIHDSGKWIFHSFGTPKTFERPEFYSRRRIQDRFTVELLEDYCAALDIRLFDTEFYGRECALIYSTTRQQGDKGTTYSDAKVQLGLES